MLLPLVSNRLIVYVIRNFLKWINCLYFIKIGLSKLKGTAVFVKQSLTSKCPNPVESSCCMKTTWTAQVLNWKAMNRDLPNFIHINLQIQKDYEISLLQLGWDLLGSLLLKKNGGWCSFDLRCLKLSSQNRPDFPSQKQLNLWFENSSKTISYQIDYESVADVMWKCCCGFIGTPCIVRRPCKITFCPRLYVLRLQRVIVYDAHRRLLCCF
jgi:hypothetical protein